MRTKSASVLLISTLVLGSFMTVVALMAAAPARAASGFDGTYDITTVASTGTYTEHEFVKIANGQISNVYVDSLYNPPNIPPGVGSGGDTDAWWYTFTGTVDSNGNAMWLGGCILAAGNMAYTYTGVIKVDGSGSGTWSKVGMEHGTWTVQKSGSGSFGLGVAGGMAPVVSVAAIAVSIAAIAIASTSVKTGFRPQNAQAPSPPYSYQPSVQTTTDTGMIPGPPEAGTPVGGAGLQYATPAPVGKPLPPRDHFMTVSQNPPRCPLHNTVALSPHFASAADPGSWFCPMCKGYPWGKN